MGALSLPSGLNLSALVLCIEAIGSLVIVGYLVAALCILVRTLDKTRTRLLVAEGALWGLNFKVAASLLKTISLHTWQQIGLFATILALRTILKWIFTWEARRLRQRSPQAEHAP